MVSPTNAEYRLMAEDEQAEFLRSMVVDAIGNYVDTDVYEGALDDALEWIKEFKSPAGFRSSGPSAGNDFMPTTEQVSDAYCDWDSSSFNRWLSVVKADVGRGAQDAPAARNGRLSLLCVQRRRVRLRALRHGQNHHPEPIPTTGRGHLMASVPPRRPDATQ